MNAERAYRNLPASVRRLIDRPVKDSGHNPEWDALAGDVRKFIDDHCIIDDAQSSTGTTAFRLWDDQADTLETIERCNRVILLKARQLGMSWLVVAYVLWLCLFHPGRVVLLFSQGQDEANELIHRIGVMFDRLPEWMRLRVKLTKETVSFLGWDNGSRVKSLPATPRAGRSFTASLVVMDEAAHMIWADRLYTACKPTIDGGGKLVVLSTANGIGGLFHRLWTQCEAKANDFIGVFLPWWSRPGRDKAWYDKQVRESADPETVKQEYPSNPAEAFLASGRLRFPSKWIEAQRPNLRPGIPTDELPSQLRWIPNLTVYHLPMGRRCVLGADVAEGLEHGDYSDAVILDWNTHEELATLNGHWEPDEYAVYLDALARYYGCPCVVERNNHGHAVLLKLKVLECPHIAEGPDERPGWLSSTATKPQSIDQLAEELRDGAIVIHSEAALNELRHYTVMANGKTSAPEGMHDDRVMSRAIAVAYSRRNLPVPAAVSVGEAQVLAPLPDLRPSMPGPVIPGSLPKGW